MSEPASGSTSHRLRRGGRAASRRARRRLRATAAVAGITAAGVGIAGPASATPAEPERSGAGGAATAAPEAGSAPNVVRDPRPTAPALDDLPQLFTVETPRIHTAGHALPEPPTEQLPRTDDAVDVDGAGQQVSPDIEYRAAAPQDRDGAMQQLDSAGLFGDLPDRVLGATEGNDIRS